MYITLNTLIIQAIYDLCLIQIKNKYTGYIGVNTEYLIDQLMELYINKTMVNIQYNKMQMEDTIKPSHLINVSFERVDYHIQYTAEIHTPFVSDKIIQTAYHKNLAMILYCNDTKAQSKNEVNCKAWTTLNRSFVKYYQYM